jgi:DNA-nicking Smr family endonuclease
VIEEPIEYPVDGILDLHQFRPNEVKNVVEDYLDACKERGICQVRIIHGKGIGTLREIVHATLRQRDDVMAFELATDSSGWGATLVTLVPDPSGSE